MNKSYSLTVLFLAVALVALAVALVSSDEAEAAQYGIRVNYKDGNNEKIANGRNPIQFNFSVTHTGDVLSMETYIDMIDLPADWTNIVYTAQTNADTYTDTFNPGGVDMEILMERGETAPVSITLTPPFNQLNTTYWFTLNFWPRKEPGLNQSFTFGVVIPQEAAFELHLWNPPPGGEFRAIPPSTVTIRFALYNTGNGVDRFLIRGESSRSDAGWKMEYVTGVDEWGFTPNLSADPAKKGPHFIDVRVPIPAGERAGVTAQITINATSMYNATKQMPPAFAAITSLQYFNFQVYINGPDKKDGTPGEEVEFQLKVNNLGNGWDTFDIKPIWDSELNPGFIASANPRQVDIDTMTNGTVQYIVKVPESAPKKTYFFTAEIKSSTPELAPVTKSFAVEVGQFYAIEMYSVGPSKTSTIPGGNLEFEVTVHNTGNGLDSIVIQDIEGAPEGWLTYTQPPEVTLLQDQDANVKIIVIVPSKFDEAPIGSYNLTVPAVSSRSDARAEHYLEIEITQFFRLEWLYQGEDITNPDRPVAQPGSIRPRQSFNPYQRDTTSYTLEVKNYGNGRDNISMEAYSPDQRITVEVTPSNTQLQRDEVKYIKVAITVPEDLLPNVYNLFVNVSSEDEEFTTRVVPLDFEIENYDAAVPTIPTFIDPTSGDVVRSQLQVEPKANLSFKLKIVNNGTRPLSQVVVRVFDNYVDKKDEDVSWNFFNYTTPPIPVGQTFTLGDRPFTPTNPPLYWYANVSGEHQLQFKVFYDAQSEKGNDLSNINVTVAVDEGEAEPVLGTAYMGMIIAVVIAVVIVAGYVFALRRKPEVDADLYSSIYGADFEDEPIMAEAADTEAAAGMTAEQQALYGDDYTPEGEAEGEYADGDYDYDYEDGDYDYEDGDYDYEEGEYEYAEGEYAEGEYAEGETTEGETTEGKTTEGEYAEGEYAEGEYAEGEYAEGEYAEGEVTEAETAEGETTEVETAEGDTPEEYYEGDYDEATDGDYEEEYSEEVTKK
jgi:uncharacterized membrane protein